MHRDPPEAGMSVAIVGIVAQGRRETLLGIVGVVEAKLRCSTQCEQRRFARRRISRFDCDSLQQLFYYPAILLGDPANPLLGELLPGQASNPFDIHYVVTQELVELPSDVYTLPQLRLGMGFTEIPEPSVVIMLAVGLTGLAIGGRRRS